MIHLRSSSFAGLSLVVSLLASASPDDGSTTSSSTSGSGGTSSSSGGASSSSGGSSSGSTAPDFGTSGTAPVFEMKATAGSYAAFEEIHQLG